MSAPENRDVVLEETTSNPRVSEETQSSYHPTSESDHHDIASQDGHNEEPGPLAVRREARRDLGWFDVAALIINKMVGSGIFTGPYLALTYTQNKNVVIVLWVLGFIYTVASMLLYLQYARDLPYTGGELVYLDQTIPKPRLLAYTMYTFYFVFIYTSCTNALQFARQVLIASDLKNVHYENINGNALRFIAICIISLISLMLYFSTANSQLMNKITASLKLILLCVVAIAGGIYIHKHGAASDFSRPSITLPGERSWTVSLLTVLFAFHGWENATLVAGEIPRYRQLRSGFMFAVFTVGSLYIIIITVFCFAFPWSELESLGPEYLAALLGGSDHAQLAAAIIIAFSTAGSIISVSYTCVRVKQTIAWTGILPWSSIWRRSAPVRRKYQVSNRPDGPYTQPKQPTVRVGTPEGGIILHWLITLLYICITAAIHPLSNAISFTGQLLVYGHFFVSVGVGLAYLRFKPGQAGRVPSPLWKAGEPATWIYGGGKAWFVKASLGLVPFSFGVVVIVAGIVSPVDRYAFYVMITLLVAALIYWATFVNVYTATKLYNFVGFSLTPCEHGKDDTTEIERQCTMCIEYDPPEPHRNAQEGYQNYNKLTVDKRSPTARFFYHAFGGSNTAMYPEFRLDSIEFGRILPRKRPAPRSAPP